MIEYSSLGINEKGNLSIGGCDTVDIAKEYKTPVYVIDESKIRENCKLYKQAIRSYYNSKGLPIYASKALSCLEICRIIKDEGMGIDVVSKGELYTAFKSGFNMELVHFHGNNKTVDEIKMAIELGVGRIVVDNLHELKIINKIADDLGEKCCISLRIKPGIDAHTHEFIKTGQIDSKFGFALETGEAYEAIKELMQFKNIILKELHCHIGSQIFELSPFELAAEVMMKFMKDIRDNLGLTIEELNLGGGFGIRYVDEDNPISGNKYIEAVSKVLKLKSKEYNLPLPYMYVEPGRSIVGDAGLTLYEVGNIKEIPNVRTYVSIDGGMCDNPRYALYKSSYKAIIANKASEKPNFKATIAGKCCESGDIIQEDTMIQTPAPGDIMAVLSTGAYNYSMASNYNRIPKPPIVMVKDGTSRLIVKRQTLDEIIENDL